MQDERLAARVHTKMAPRAITERTPRTTLGKPLFSAPNGASALHPSSRGLSCSPVALKGRGLVLAAEQRQGVPGGTNHFGDIGAIQLHRRQCQRFGCYF